MNIINSYLQSTFARLRAARFGETGSVGVNRHSHSLFRRSRASRAMRGEVEWAHQDSNLGQAGYEPAALTAEL